MNDIILQSKDLQVGYDTKAKPIIIAGPVNIALNKGELIGLVGANGIGKSTLLRTLSGIQKPLLGEIYINDRTLSSYVAIELAQHLSLVLTEPVASKNLTVFELVLLGRQPYTNWLGTLSTKDIQISTEALRLVNITELKNHKCYELSDGQLQKVMIARALAQDTDLIILDEPTSHLDMYHKAYILRLLKKLTQETGKTILFSSHEIDLAIQLCDRMIVMNPSEVTTGQPCELISNGTFDKLFPEDLIAFDKNTGTFKIKK